jgi:hypothetical protein
MRRRRLWLGSVLVTLGAILPGCETLDHALRSRTVEGPSHGDESESKKAVGTEEATTEVITKGFFKPSRGSGGWSSEARDIENSLGVR